MPSLLFLVGGKKRGKWKMVFFYVCKDLSFLARLSYPISLQKS